MSDRRVAERKAPMAFGNRGKHRGGPAVRWVGHSVTAAAVLLGAPLCAVAQPNDCLPLTPTGTQGGALLPNGRMNVRFGGTAGARLALDVYTHADAAIRPLAVVLRGGRGTIGQRSSYVGQLIETLGDAGFVVAAADYRSESLDASVTDVTGALRLLTTCHGAALRVDQKRVVLVAEDTAAPAALEVASRLKQSGAGELAAAPAPAAVVIAGGRLANAPPPTVPTLIVHGANDTEVPISDARTLCTRTPAPCALVPVAGASHRVENWWPSQWGYKTELLAWLSGQVDAAPPPARPAGSAPGLRKRLVYDGTHELTLDAWVPPAPGRHAAVVIVHGGGWEAGDRVTYVAPMLALAASRGLAWVSVDYRLTPQVANGEQIADVKAALAWVTRHARELRVDPRRLILVGESASGQLVAHVAASEPWLAGVVSFYGVYDLEAMAGDPADPRSLARRLFRLSALDDAGRAIMRKYSPVRHASKALPPTLLVAGTADRLITQQRAYAAALRDAGARVDTIEIEGAPHGMEAWNEQSSWRVWEKQVADWIGRVVR